MSAPEGRQSSGLLMESVASTEEAAPQPARAGHSEASDVVDRAVVEHLQSLVEKAVADICEKERALLEELLAPINEHISNHHKRRSGSCHLPSDTGSVDSDPRRVGGRSVTGRKGNHGSVKFRCDKTRASHDLRPSCTSRSSRNSRGTTAQGPQDLDSLQKIFDRELFASASLQSYRANQSWPVEFAKGIADIVPTASTVLSPTPETSLEVRHIAAPACAPAQPPEGRDAPQSDAGTADRAEPARDGDRDPPAVLPGQLGRFGSGLSGPFARSALLPVRRERRESITVESLRSDREAELTENFQTMNSATSSVEGGNLDDDAPAHRGVGIHALRACGLLPWSLVWDEEEDEGPDVCQQLSRALWQKVLLCLSIVACGGCLWLTISSWQSACDSGRSCSQVSMLFDVSMSVGSTIGLLHVSLIQRVSLSRAHDLLLSYAHHHQFLHIWEAASIRALCCTCVLLVCVLLGRARVLLVVDAAEQEHAALNIAVSLIGVGLFMSLEFLILHVCAALAAMVDRFTVEFVQHQSFGMAIQEWNLIQATLRQVCFAVQWVFLVLQVTAMVVVTTSLMAAFHSRSVEAPALLPGTVVACSVALVFLRATTVTEKCERLTRFINSLSFTNKDIDRDRQYVVEYINNSGAGFYFFSVRLTSQMAVKIMYVSGLAVFYTATKAVSVL